MSEWLGQATNESYFLRVGASGATVDAGLWQHLRHNCAGPCCKPKAPPVRSIATLAVTGKSAARSRGAAVRRPVGVLALGAELSAVVWKKEPHRRILYNTMLLIRIDRHLVAAAPSSASSRT